jgi:protein-tyrosine phosphatase
MRRPSKILITQCLQADFVQPLTRYEALPNLLHVGYAEALRLMGEDPATGPVQKLMDWAYAQPEEALAIVHVRDRHDASDPRQTAHLRHFGPHCLAGTPGAAPAYRVPPAHARRAVTEVASLTLNDFHGTDLAEALAPYAGREIAVGLVGVWTEAKITYLAYELTTRYPEFTVATCSPLTASSSLSNHFLALSQLEKLLGVRVFASLGEFFRFLGADAAPLPAPAAQGAGARLDVHVHGAATIDPASDALIRYLFRDCKRLDLRVLDGGFSGNLVLGTDSVDQGGHRQAPHVLKIGAHEPIARERQAFERVEAILGNAAPRIVEFADYGDRGAIKYRYASMGGGGATSLQKLYMRGTPLATIGKLLRELFQEQLGRFYAAAQLEPLDLLEYYGFKPGMAARVRASAEKVAGQAFPERGPVRLFGRELPSLVDFYRDALEAPELRAKTAGSHYVAYVHGDLNGANVIVDAHDNVWIIDFFHTHRGHVLKDLIKLENDLLYIFCQLREPTELADAFALSEALLAVEDLGAPPPIALDALRSPEVRRAAETVLALRSLYGPLVQADRDPLQVFVGQLRYAVHTLSFDESSALQKQWALYTASLLGDRVAERFKGAFRLRIDWLPNGSSAGAGALGLTLLPGRRDRGRDLAVDVAAIRAAGVTDVVVLATDAELTHYGVGDLLDAYARAGLATLHAPILDGKVPPVETMRALVADVAGRVRDGKKVLVHCVGGLGRAGTVAACWLRSQGVDAEAAIRAVRAARSQRAVETAAQADMIRAFAG